MHQVDLGNTPVNSVQQPLTQQFKVVTPAMAREWLLSNKNNRALRRNRVEEWKGIYERGEYKVTHQGVGFGQDGILQDGQHRLSALAEMPDSFSITLSVAHGLELDAFKVHDLGLKRSYADALRINQGLSECSKYLASLANGSGRMSPARLQPFVDFVRPYYEPLLAQAQSRSRTWSSAPVRAAAVVQLARGVSASHIHNIYRALVTADFDAMPPVAQSMFRTELNRRINANEKDDLFSRSLKLFDPAYMDYKRIHIGDASIPLAETRDLLRAMVIRD